MTYEPFNTTNTRKPYEPQGAMLDLWAAKEKVVCAYGPAGTGKSRTILEMMFHFADIYPKTRILFVRQTKSSLIQSVLTTWEGEVVPPGHPIVSKGNKKSHRQYYVFPNGSEVVATGMDQDDKILSSFYHLVFIEEATELSEDSFNTLLTRVRASEGYNSKAPLRLYMSCNPEQKSHWIYQRALVGDIKLVKTSHTDNALYWDAKASNWTREGYDYVVCSLQHLTGRHFERFYLGEWGGSGNLILPNFEKSRNVIAPFDVREVKGKEIASVDFGFNDPFCYLGARLTEEPIIVQSIAGEEFYLKEGSLVIHTGRYKTRVQTEVHLAHIKKHLRSKKLPSPSRVITDHAPTDFFLVETAFKHRVDDFGNCVVKKADKKFKWVTLEQIDSAFNSLGKKFPIPGPEEKWDFKPSIVFFEDFMMHEPDPELVLSRRISNPLDELVNLSYQLDKYGIPIEQVIATGPDHLVDALVYMAVDAFGISRNRRIIRSA